jgi:putative hemolysin
MKRTLGLVALLAMGALTLAGCNKNAPVENPDENAEIPNPAAVYCEENGGTLNLEE